MMVLVENIDFGRLRLFWRFPRYYLALSPPNDTCLSRFLLPPSLYKHLLSIPAPEADRLCDVGLAFAIDDSISPFD